MNFIKLINDLQEGLTVPHYVDFLWGTITGKQISVEVTENDREAFENHLPLNLEMYLLQCIRRLCSESVSDEAWQILNEKYFCSVMYFIMDKEDPNKNNALYAADLIVLLSIVEIPGKQLLHEVTYMKILGILTKYLKAEHFLITTIMQDLNSLLSIISLSEESLKATIDLFHAFTYSCDNKFQDMAFGTRNDNVAYIAYVNLRVLANKLVQEERDEKLYDIVLPLMDNFKTIASNLQTGREHIYKVNVMAFFKQNWCCFRTIDTCYVMRALKHICLSSGYNKKGIAELLQQLPTEVNQDFLYFFVEILHSNSDEHKRKCLDLVVPLLECPPEYETTFKRLTKTEILLRKLVTLLNDQNERVRTKALKIVVYFSENSMGRQALKKAITCEDPVNEKNILDVLYNMIDPAWNKKLLNISYIEFVCNIFIIRRDLFNKKDMNRLRNICTAGYPYDLTACIHNFKRILEFYASDQHVRMNVLGIFCKHMFLSLSKSSLFARELADMIFCNITLDEHRGLVVWNILNDLISHNFPVDAIFEKLHFLEQIDARLIDIILFDHVEEGYSRTPALKLVCIMLNFVEYHKTMVFEEILEDWLKVQLPDFENGDGTENEIHVGTHFYKFD